MKRSVLYHAFCALPLLAASCGNTENASDAGGADTSAAKPPDIRQEEIVYQDDSVSLRGFIAYDANRADRIPVVLVVPEWWGINEYPKNRAVQLAGLGYFAMAVDMYGNGKVAATPDEAQKAAATFYSNPSLNRTRLEAALAKARTYAQADTTRIAAIGYCFGGAMVLNGAKMGLPLKGVVSFHGSLDGVPPQKGMTAQILVCHGEADKFVPEEDIAKFKQQLDSAGVTYTFKTYPGATHAFTNPKATEVGRQFNMPIEYNGAADTASWIDMRQFLTGIFQ